MDVLDVANKRLKVTRESFGQDYEAQIVKLADKETNLKQRLNDLEKKKIEVSKTSGNADAAEDDLIEINAGGKIVAGKRSTLTQLKGSKFEALFGGRWDKELQ